jgi:hypothetical protein
MKPHTHNEQNGDEAWEIAGDLARGLPPRFPSSACACRDRRTSACGLCVSLDWPAGDRERGMPPRWVALTSATQTWTTNDAANPDGDH